MNMCEKCGYNGDLIEENYSDMILVICPECYNFEYKTCIHERSSYVKYLIGGSFRVQNVCQVCHKLHGTFIKQSGLDLENIKTIDKEKYNFWYTEQNEKFNKRYSWLLNIKKEKEQKEWFDKHNQYLKSNEWLEKREMVLRRDNYLCQSCLKSKATQVHHLNYNHWGKEPLFDLISVCDECHELITEMDRKILTN